MKKNSFFQSFAFAALTLCAATVFTLTTVSCSKEDDALNVMPEVPETADMQAADEQKTQALLEALCEVDDQTKAIGQPRLGRVLYPGTATISYAIANTREEAQKRYRTLISNIEEGLTATDVRQGDIHLTFTEGCGDGETGRIIVDCPRLQQVLTAIIFITEARWPENEDVASQINFLSVWRNKKTKQVFACVKPANPDTGYLLYLNNCRSGGDKKACRAAISALSMITIDMDEEYNRWIEEVQDIFKEISGGAYFDAFTRLNKKVTNQGYVRKIGDRICKIRCEGGHCDFKYRSMPVYSSKEPSSKDQPLCSESMSFERETRLDTKVWECLRH